ncbi:MAG TPA: TonB-dependent receptor [Bacteroidales bacterium]|nr:TonB-dependent receptor [Bacteroidales bacterium]
MNIGNFPQMFFQRMISTPTCVNALIFIAFFLFLSQPVQSSGTEKGKGKATQEEELALTTINLREFTIQATAPRQEILRMPAIRGTKIFSGKKNEVIRPTTMDADLSTNNARQIFAKVPGVSVWENDGSGIQLGIATRGLNPNRSWEFNVRKNNYDISSEVFGYPEAYYTPPMEAVSRIELVRGAASLQFGPQFGGLLNFIIKEPATDRPFAFETQQTVGSYGLFNSYNSIGGTSGNFSYFAYYHRRSANGWRTNSRYQIDAGYIALNYAFSPRLRVSLQYSAMDYASQQPGGLTDAQFAVDARQSHRERNWFSTPWNVAALILNYDVSERSLLNVTLFGLLAERNSVGFVRPIHIADTFNVNLRSFHHRQVDRDLYFNYGAEARFLQRYQLFNNESALSVGMRLYRGETDRLQLGIGTTKGDMDFAITTLQPNGKEFGRDLFFVTDNIALFAANIFRITPRLSITPGFRYEIINNSAEGTINSSPTGDIGRRQHNRGLLLLGLGAEYKTSETTNLYANFSQAFRPVTFAELTPAATTDIIDPDMRDQKGFNIDAGFRGTLANAITFDVGMFYLHYGDRVGTINQNGVNFRTNVGTSVSKGLESFIMVEPLKFLNNGTRFGNIILFASNALIDATYTEWNNPALDLSGNRVENAPEYIHRFGLTYHTSRFSITTQLNSIGEVFTDATNTIAPNAAGTIGRIDGFRLIDISASYRFGANYNIRIGVNNLTNEVYSTRRAGGYPGPGLLPGQGRTAYISVGARF